MLVILVPVIKMKSTKYIDPKITVQREVNKIKRTRVSRPRYGKL